MVSQDQLGSGADRASRWISPFEVNGSMSRNVKGAGFGSICNFALDQARVVALVGLARCMGTQAQDFTTALDLNDLVNFQYIPEIPWIQTGCCASI